MEQLNDNVAAVDLQLSTWEMAALDQVSALPSEISGLDVGTVIRGSARADQHFAQLKATVS